MVPRLQNRQGRHRFEDGTRLEQIGDRLELVAPSSTTERSAGLNSGGDAAANISPVPPSITTALPPLAVMPFSSAVEPLLHVLLQLYVEAR